MNDCSDPATKPGPPAALKVLFVCSLNRWRSLTGEKILQGLPGYSVKSAGTEQGARVTLTEGHIGWADLIFVMEKKHKVRVRSKFGEKLLGKELICLHISDDYPYMDPELIELLRQKTSQWIEWREGS